MDKTTEQTPVVGVPATPEETSWCAFYRRQEQRSVDVCRDTAQVLVLLSGLMALLCTIGLLAIYGGVGTPWEASCAICMWIASLVFGVVAMLPWPWHTHRDCPDEIRDSFKVIASAKWVVTLGAAVLFVAGLAGLFLSVSH